MAYRSNLGFRGWGLEFRVWHAVVIQGLGVGAQRVYRV